MTLPRTFFAFPAACLCALSASAHDSPEPQRAANVKYVRITVENLTAGQAFSPPVFFTHNGAAPPLFNEGQPAPFDLQRIAEEGNVGPLLTAHVTKTQGGAYRGAAVALSTQPGRSRSVLLSVSRNHPLVSGAFMLAMTNDGFAGMNAINAFELKEPQTMELYAFDAGTENNNELGDYLIAMEGTARDPENGAVQRHTGLRGDADAPGFWKFDPARPVARVTITPAY
jgi:hypothetical protein